MGGKRGQVTAASNCSPFCEHESSSWGADKQAHECLEAWSNACAETVVLSEWLGSIPELSKKKTWIYTNQAICN